MKSISRIFALSLVLVLNISADSVKDKLSQIKNQLDDEMKMKQLKSLVKTKESTSTFGKFNIFKHQKLLKEAEAALDTCTTNANVCAKERENARNSFLGSSYHYYQCIKKANVCINQLDLVKAKEHSVQVAKKLLMQAAGIATAIGAGAAIIGAGQTTEQTNKSKSEPE